MPKSRHRKNHKKKVAVRRKKIEQKTTMNKKLKDTQQLGISVYIHALKKQIEKEVESRYSKRIEYLVGANNELMKELEQWERVGKRLEKPLWKTADMKEGYDE